VRATGVSNYAVGDLEAAVAAGPIDSYQPGYHLMRREIEAAELPWCAANGVGVIAYGPLAHGLLTGKMTAETTFAPGDWRAESELFADDAFPERVAVARELDALAREAGRPGVAELAVAWVLRRPEVTSAIIGARSPEQAVANAALAGRPLSADEEAAIQEVLARHPDASRHYGHGEPPDPSSDA
jgi:aryl-alcohol dehydrogenase-like predicted oxidoreductase